MEQRRITCVLVANRAEIASRVFRTCSSMGITSVAVYSDADQDAPYVQEADVAISIGGNTPAESYLDQDKIINAAKQSGATAIHPGYGFLSENASFAERCAAEGIIFIGPSGEAISAMGSKANAKDIMEKANVPVIPGYRGEDQSNAKLLAEAEKIGYPLLIKATAGGGGRGIKIVRASSELEQAIDSAKREALNAFGDDRLLMEKYIESGRHIEFQIFGDQHGQIIHLHERECTIQRRYQKVLEESPSPVLTEAKRAEMGKAAVLAGQALGYYNAGTVEFIYDNKTDDFYFLEVNTRLQVEHPVTEQVTGLDLVQMQLEVASGQPLSVKQEDIQPRGYAIEARLYAEDPANGFMPATGEILRFSTPEVDGLRVDTGVQSGSVVSMYYDAMLAKIIVSGSDRSEVHAKLAYTLSRMQCLGLPNNIQLLGAIVADPDFQKGEYDTQFLAERIDALLASTSTVESVDRAMIAATLQGWSQRESSRTLLAGIPSGWRNSHYQPQSISYHHNEEDYEVKYRYTDGTFDFTIADREYTARIISSQSEELRLLINGIQTSYTVIKDGTHYHTHSVMDGSTLFDLIDRYPATESDDVSGSYTAPMPSQIVKIAVSAGDEVAKGDTLMIISSMKIENTITATEDGTVEEIYVEEGSSIKAGTVLLKMQD